MPVSFCDVTSRTAPVATAASIALPPWRNISRPACGASGSLVATMPWRARTSERPCASQPCARDPGTARDRRAGVGLGRKTGCRMASAIAPCPPRRLPPRRRPRPSRGPAPLAGGRSVGSVSSIAGRSLASPSPEQPHRSVLRAARTEKFHQRRSRSNADAGPSSGASTGSAGCNQTPKRMRGSALNCCQGLNRRDIDQVPTLE